MPSLRNACSEGLRMISFLSGIVVTGAGIGSLWYCKPRAGKPQWFIEAPVLDWLIPTVIVSALGVGLALVISGAVH
jgi:ABC-type enterobactin transport system permease subunit